MIRPRARLLSHSSSFKRQGKPCRPRLVLWLAASHLLLIITSVLVLLSKHYDLGGQVPCPAGGRRRRTVGIDDSVESAEGTFAEWRGYAVTNPTKHKRLRAKLSRPALWRMRGTVRTKEGLAMKYNLTLREFFANNRLP